LHDTKYGDRDTIRSKYSRAWLDLGLEDLHGDNWRVDNFGRPVVVDLGGWATEYPYDSVPPELIPNELANPGPYDEDEDEDEGTCYCDECKPSYACEDCEDAGCSQCLDKPFTPEPEPEPAGLTTRMHQHRPALVGTCGRPSLHPSRLPQPDRRVAPGQVWVGELVFAMLGHHGDWL
jgi:hypothetical protein